MKAFFYPIIGGQIRPDKAVRMKDRYWTSVRTYFIEVEGRPEEEVTRDMDGRGYIERKTPTGVVRYVQD